MTINHEKYKLLIDRNCNKGKHKFRENNFGVCWCVICGLLASGNTQIMEENDKITIKDITL